MQSSPTAAALQVGHNALGAGQIVDQGAKCVDKALATGEAAQPRQAEGTEALAAGDGRAWGCGRHAWLRKSGCRRCRCCPGGQVGWLAAPRGNFVAGLDLISPSHSPGAPCRRPVQTGWVAVDRAQRQAGHPAPHRPAVRRRCSLPVGAPQEAPQLVPWCRFPGLAVQLGGLNITHIQPGASGTGTFALAPAPLSSKYQSAAVRRARADARHHAESALLLLSRPVVRETRPLVLAGTTSSCC